MHLTINAEDIAAEDFGHEVVIIHLRRGTYYTLNQSAAVLWRALAAGLGSDEALTKHLKDCLGHVQETLRTDVGRFIEQLLAEELVNKTTADKEEAAFPQPCEEIDAYEPPMLEIFSDIQQILTLDPIHEVTETGWPHAREEE